MVLPDDADVLMEYFRTEYPDIVEPRHLPDKKGGPATLIGGRRSNNQVFFYVSHDDLRRRRDFYSIDNDFWWDGFH